MTRMMEVLSLGAGVQSTTVMLMSLEGDLPKLDHAIFADTGWEPPAVYSHLRWLLTYIDNRIPIHIVCDGNIRDDHVQSVRRNGMRTTIPFFVDTNGKREGKTFRKCTSEYKLEPIHKFMRRELLGLRKGQRAPKEAAIRHWLGISVDEYQRAKPSREHWKVNWHPLIDKRISRAGCLTWLEKHGYPEPPRSACVGCPFRSRAEWRKMKRDNPEVFADACDFDDVMRDSGAMSGTAYLHRSLVPLRDVDLRNDVDRGQLTLWNDECEGMCGV